MAFDPDVEVIDMYLKTKIEKLSNLPNPIFDEESKLSVYYTPTERSVNSRRNSPTLEGYHINMIEKPPAILDGIHINMIERSPALPDGIHINMIEKGPPRLLAMIRPLPSEPPPSAQSPPGSPSPTTSKAAAGSRPHKHKGERKARVEEAKPSSEPLLGRDVVTFERGRRRVQLPASASSPELRASGPAARVLLAVELAQPECQLHHAAGQLVCGECAALCRHSPL